MHGQSIFYLEFGMGQIPTATLLYLMGAKTLEPWFTCLDASFIWSNIAGDNLYMMLHFHLWHLFKLMDLLKNHADHLWGNWAIWVTSVAHPSPTPTPMLQFHLKQNSRDFEFWSSWSLTKSHPWLYLCDNWVFLNELSSPTLTPMWQFHWKKSFFSHGLQETFL
jgi:hypothetical protein